MKNKIINATIDLSNEMGIHRVTTNHVIERLAISPGTFYYHFKNREEIIRKIFDRITVEFDGLFSGDINSFTMQDFIMIIRKMYRLYYRYRTFYYNLPMLLDRDEILEESYRKNYRLKRDKLLALTLYLEEKGILKKFDTDDERNCYLENLWILSDYRLSFLRATGEGEDTDFVEKGTENYLMFIKPYLSGNSSLELEKK